MSDKVLTVDEAQTASLAELRADIIRSAARGQGPTFISAKLDLLIAAAAQSSDDSVRALREACLVAADTLTTVDEWMGHASTRQAAQDALWRLNRAVQRAGIPTHVSNDLRWRGSIIRALEQAGLGIGECGTVRIRRKTDLPHMHASGTQITPDRLWSVITQWGDHEEREAIGRPL